MGSLRLPRRVLLKRLLIVPAALVSLAVLFAGVSLIGALRTPGNQSFEAKWADWLRSHHAATLANALEQYYYTHNAPPKGGQPKALNPVPTDPVGAKPKDPPGLTSVRHLPAPGPVPLVVSPALPGEGQWTATGISVNGIPAIYEAQFRADQTYTSQITSAVWIDPTLLKVALIPGAQEPGGSWTETPYINSSQLPSAVAAFNGGFRMQDAHGGFYLDGKQQVPLQNGAASMVIYSDGHIDIGTWGKEVSMVPGVTAVLQNLVPIVDNGQTAANATYSDTHIWGATLGANTVVARSGVGVTSTGALVYVAGPALTAKSLAESLQRAGAVRAMALDINPEWVTFNFYEHNPSALSLVTPSKLYPQMQRPASRYLGPTRESRDFFLISLPSGAP
jgi:hypothetical protein